MRRLVIIPHASQIIENVQVPIAEFPMWIQLKDLKSGIGVRFDEQVKKWYLETLDFHKTYCVAMYTLDDET